MQFSIRNLLLCTAATSFLFVVMMVAYAIVNSYGSLREINRYSENKQYVLKIRALERNLGEEMHLGTLVLAMRSDQNKHVESEEFSRHLRALHKSNQDSYREVYESIAEYSLNEHTALIKTLEAIENQAESINGLYEALINGSYDVHVQTWLETMQDWVQKISSLKLELFVPQNVHGQALKHQLVTEEAVDQIYFYVLQEGQIITWLLAKQIPLSQEDVDRITHMRGFTEQAKEELNNYIQTIDLSGDDSEHWKLPLLEAYRALEARLEELSDVRRSIYAASLIGEASPITLDQWESVLDKTLQAATRLQEEIEKPSNILLSEAGYRISRTLLFAMLLGGLFVGAMVVLQIIMVKRVLVPVSIVTDRMVRLAEGNVDVDIPTAKHTDEIGQMMTALKQFRDAQVKVGNQARMLKLGEEVAKMGHWQVDVKTGMLTWSDQVYEIHGLDKDHYAPEIESAINFYHPDDRETVRDCVAAAIEHKESFSHISRLVRGNDGEVRFVESKGRVALDKSGRVNLVYGTFQDITERMASDRMLEAAKDRAEESARLKSEFLANMSHEIRTPMNGVVGLANLLLDEGLNSKQRAYAMGVINSAENLLQIVNDILDFSKIEAGKIELDIVPFDLPTVIEEVAQVSLFKAQEKGVELLVDFPPDLPACLAGDSLRIRQIMLNLLSNATKFTHEGYIAVQVRKLHEDGNEVTIAIRVIDTGIGIPAGRHEAVFGKFDQADSSTTRKYGGTGLGLAICKQLIQLMGGQISLESSLGEGSTFTVTLPLMRVMDKECHIERPDFPHVIGASVLVVEPVTLSADVIANELRFYGARAVVCATAEEALSILEESTQGDAAFDVVFINKILNDTSGLQLGARIMRDKALSHTRVLLITPNPVRGDADMMQRYGFAGYMPKPLMPFSIAMMVDYVMSQGDSHTGFADRHMLAEHYGLEEKRRLSDLRFNGVRILLAEDNAVSSEITVTILERLGCLVVAAANGREALEHFESQAFHLIFMDCQMPDMDGFQATKEIRRVERRRGLVALPIIAFTANAFAEDKQACLAAGMTDYLSKPVKPTEMAQMMAKYLPESSWGIVKNERQSPRHAAPDTRRGDYIDRAMLNSLQQVMKPKQLTALIDSFENNTREMLVTLKALCKAGDHVGIAKVAHSLSASTINMGCTMLHVELEQIEQAARAKHAVAALAASIEALPDILEVSVATLRVNMKESEA